MRIWRYIFFVLLLFLVVIIIAIVQLPDGNLHIVACNVGQGDAILVTYGSTQILTDGGPDNKVLDCLGRYMPFWDRKIELAISTHPDSDHSTGLLGVLRNYKVDALLINPIDPGTQIYQLLKNEVGDRGIPVINPVDGTKLRLGLIYLDVVNPTDELFSKLSPGVVGDKLSGYSIGKDTNLYSIVYKLSYKNFSGIFTGDMPPEVSDNIAETWQMGAIEYIKVPHHGSKNGLTQNLLEKIVPSDASDNPPIAVISVGKNSWGFPAPEILDVLRRYNFRVLRTDQMGDVEVVSDGERFWVRGK